ncbi:MAG: alanine racemase [Oscillospiraceae bacterium]|nr:alanine racemase [Oscillospiraceae bacterium]
MEKKFIIKREDIAKNIDILREKANSARIYAVLKGNAYGMGLIPFANELYNCGLRHFSVTDLNDALILKESFPDAQALLLTPCGIPEDIEKAVDSGVTLSVDCLENAQLISEISKAQGKTTILHIKIDTGMGRYGFLPAQTEKIQKVCELENLNVEGIFTHLHSAFNKKAAPSLKQFEIFSSVIDRLKENGREFPIKHICNSTAIFRFPHMHLTAVRAGSALIGRVNPICGETGLCKVGKLYGQIVDIRTLPKGHNIGYAALFKTEVEQKIACVNAGYADGIAVTKANDTFRFIDILRYGFNDLKLFFRPTPLVCKINDRCAVSLGRIGMTNLVLDAQNLGEIAIGDEVEIPINPIYLSPIIIRKYM